MPALYRDYLRAVDQVRMLLDIERNFERLAEMKRLAERDQDQGQNYNRPFAHFRMFGGD
jgi:hypothetical protein